jgi:hypothetical protein
VDEAMGKLFLGKEELESISLKDNKDKQMAVSLICWQLNEL